MNEKLYEIFNIEPTQETKQVPVVIENKSEEGEDVEDDYRLARSTLRDLVKKSASTLDDAISLARNSEHPRAYEVVGQIIKTVSDVSKDLLTLQKQKREIKSPEEINTSIHQQNNIVFAGSTQELMQLINQQKQIDAD